MSRLIWLIALIERASWVISICQSEYKEEYSSQVPVARIHGIMGSRMLDPDASFMVPRLKPPKVENVR